MDIKGVRVVVKTRGMWKLALITFLLRRQSMRHDVHVHLNANGQQDCIYPNPTTLPVRTPPTTSVG